MTADNDVRERENQVQGESEDEQLNRELSELLQELRVVLPGVQVTFAFLLSLPFTQRFQQMNQLQMLVYYGTLICTAISTAMLMAPSTQHRLRWRQHERERRLETANRLVIAGTTLLALAVTGVIFLISDFLFDINIAIAFGLAVAALFTYFWYVLPLIWHGR